MVIHTQTMVDHGDRDRDEKSGRYTETYPLEAFIDVLREQDGAGTRDVSDELGCSYELAYQRLRELEGDGRVTSRRIGNARLWLPADE